MTEQETQNGAVARKFFEEFLGKGDLSVAEEVLDERVQAITGLKPTGPINGREEYKQIFAAFFDAFPLLPGQELTIEDFFVAGDRAVCRFRSVQKHAKEFFGVPATGRDITLIETHVQRLRDGRIVENVVSATNLEFEMLMAPVLSPLILGGQQSAQKVESAKADNIAVARRFAEQVLGNNDTAAANEIVDENIVYHTGFVPAPLHGRAAFLAAINSLHTAFSGGIDLKVEDIFEAADGERVVLRFTAPSVHTGELMGVKATGKKINMIETHVIRFRDGKIIEDFASDNVFDFGVLVAPSFPDELPTEVYKKITAQS